MQLRNTLCFLLKLTVPRCHKSNSEEASTLRRPPPTRTESRLIYLQMGGNHCHFRPCVTRWAPPGKISLPASPPSPPFPSVYQSGTRHAHLASAQTGAVSTVVAAQSNGLLFRTRSARLNGVGRSLLPNKQHGADPPSKFGAADL